MFGQSFKTYIAFLFYQVLCLFFYFALEIDFYSPAENRHLCLHFHKRQLIGRPPSEPCASTAFVLCGPPSFETIRFLVFVFSNKKERKKRRREIDIELYFKAETRAETREDFSFTKQRLP